MLRNVLLSAWLLVCAFIAAILVVLPSPIDRDEPRDLPWQLPDYRSAQTSWLVGDDGRIHTEVEHFFLAGITPEMMSWFYQQLPVATVQLNGERLPLYHIFHPREHGTIRVLSPATDGTRGMAEGAVIERVEWFGDYDSRGRATIVEFSESGMRAIATFLGLQIGDIKHQFSARDGGTAYHVSSVIGSDHKLFGSLVNYILRTYIFHPQMLEQWRRHQVEEVSSLQFFLPAIYAQRADGDHYFIQ